MNSEKNLYFKLSYKELCDLIKMLEIGKFRYTLGQRTLCEKFEFIYKNWNN